MTFKTALALVFLVCAVTGQETKCTNPKVMENFNVKQYVGVWYEIEKNPVLFERDLHCSFENGTLVDDYMSVYFQGVNGDGGTKILTAKVTFPDKSEPAKCIVKFGELPYSFNYSILDTDYQEYSVTYACNTVGKQANHEYLWILSRTKALASATIEKIYQLLDAIKVDRTKLKTIDQSCK